MEASTDLDANKMLLYYEPDLKTLGPCYMATIFLIIVKGFLLMNLPPNPDNVLANQAIEVDVTSDWQCH